MHNTTFMHRGRELSIKARGSTALGHHKIGRERRVVGSGGGCNFVAVAAKAAAVCGFFFGG